MRLLARQGDLLLESVAHPGFGKQMHGARQGRPPACAAAAPGFPFPRTWTTAPPVAAVRISPTSALSVMLPDGIRWLSMALALRSPGEWRNSGHLSWAASLPGYGSTGASSAVRSRSGRALVPGPGPSAMRWCRCAHGRKRPTCRPSSWPSVIPWSSGSPGRGPRPTPRRTPAPTSVSRSRPVGAARRCTTRLWNPLTTMLCSEVARSMTLISSNHAPRSATGWRRRLEAVV